MKEVYYEPTGMGNNSDETPEDGIQIIDSYGTIHDTSLHWHHALELVLMLSGGVIYTVDGTSHRTNAGELHIINSQHMLLFWHRLEDLYSIKKCPQRSLPSVSIPF